MPPDTPPQAQPDPSLVLDAFKGLKNTVTAERLSKQELARAVNIDLDDAGQVHRRRGYRKVMDGDFHSLFTVGDGTLLGVRDGDLGIIRPDFTFVSLAPVGDDPVAYVEIGPLLFFSNVVASGKIVLDAWTVQPWGAEVSPGRWVSPVVNPTATLGPVAGRLFGRPPLASDLTYWNGRIYLADDRMVWATELFLYDLVDKTRGFWQFEHPVTMLRAVSDGVYVGTIEALYFVGGSFRQPKRVPVMGSGVIPGSAVYVPSEIANPPAVKHVDLAQNTPVNTSILFLTSHGYSVASEGGQCFNVTEAEVAFPDMESAVAMFRRQDGMNHYVAVANSGGTPSMNSRIGDYLDAEIIRGPGFAGG